MNLDLDVLMQTLRAGIISYLGKPVAQRLVSERHRDNSVAKQLESAVTLDSFRGRKGQQRIVTCHIPSDRLDGCSTA